MKIKICGITNLRDAKAAVAAGADFLGFIFYKKSPRFIAPETARRIIAGLPRAVKAVGVFVNEKQGCVREIAAHCGLDYLQFHGHESPVYLRAFPGHKAIKAVRVKGGASLAGLNRYQADYFLFDAYRSGRFGGTGKTFSWDLLKLLAKKKVRCFISGGLTPENVGDLLKVFRPYAVDVSSGVEKSPGTKDHARMKKFIRSVKG